MSIEVVTVLMFLGVLVGALSGIPVAFVLGALGLFFGILFWGTEILTLIPMRLFGILSEYIFAAVVLFVFMGCVIERSGWADRAYQVLYRWMGPLRGGLALATIVIGTIFAASIGIIGASVTLMGLIALPAMLKARYSKALATGVTTAGGTLGILIPPSIMLIIYAPMAGISVVEMYAGAIFPGLLLSTLYMVYIAILCWLNPRAGPAMPVEERVKVASAIKVLSEAMTIIPFFVLIGLVLGSIFFGLASPTEAAALGVMGALAQGVIYRGLSWRDFKEALYRSLRISSMIIFVALGANIFTGTFLGSGCGKVVENFLLGLGFGPWGILATFLFTVFILGFFIDWLGILFITVPIFNPILTHLGFNPLWVGLLVCICLQTSFLTPPFAFAIFYLKGLAPKEVTLIDIYRGVVPFVVLQLCGLALCVVFPAIPLWLPNMLYK